MKKLFKQCTELTEKQEIYQKTWIYLTDNSDIVVVIVVVLEKLTRLVYLRSFCQRPFADICYASVAVFCAI